ncbi:hypothetical protein AOX55_0000165 [Sinorhizobium fredii CCBAU 25509]|nr:hypothetical protein AOX55_0000165 [Sinorhizobium fredii CCBAU 25509]
MERGIQLFMAEHGLSREAAILLILKKWMEDHSFIPLDSDQDGEGE